MDKKKHQVFRYGVIFHKIFGVWPENDQLFGRYDKVKGYGITVVILAISAFQFTALLEKNDGHISENAIDFIASLIAVAKVLPLVLNRNNALILLQTTNEFNMKATVQEIKIINRWQSIQDNIIKFCMKSYTAILIIYLCIPILKNKGFPLQGMLPDIAVKSPWYEITYTVEAILSTLRLIGVLSSDTFCITFLCQLCCQLELTKDAMGRLTRGNKQSLLLAIKRHANALDYGTMICSNFSTIFVLQYILVAAFLSLAGIIALNTENFLILIKMFLMAILATITMLIMCFVGETVTNASLDIASAIECYAYNAFLEDIAMLKLASFVLCRAQKPLCLSMGRQGTLNLRFFSESMNKVVSFFMVLKTVME